VLAALYLMKPFLLKALPLLGVALLTVPGRADDPALSLDYKGQSVVEKGSAGAPGYTTKWGYNMDGDNATTMTAFSSGLRPGETQTGTASGNFVLVFTWPSKDKMPPFVGVRFQQGVAGSGGRNDPSAITQYKPFVSSTPGQVTLSVEASDKDKDTEHETKVGNNYSYSSLAQTPWKIVTISTKDATVKANGSCELRYDLPAIKGTFNVTNGLFTQERDGDEGGGYFYSSDGTWASLHLDMAGYLDSRTVWLTRRGGSDTTRYVDSSGLWITEGDSTYSYRAYDLYPTGANDMSGNPQKTLEWRDQNNLQYIVPNPTGNWTQAIINPGVTARSWKWTPDIDPTLQNAAGDPKGATYAIQVMPLGAYEKFYGDWRSSTAGAGSPPPTFTFDYELTDNIDGAKAKARYILHLHHEWENWRPNADNPSNIQQAQFPSGPAIGNTWIQCGPTETTPTQATFNGTIGTDIGTSVGVSGGFSIADFLNFGVDVGKSWSKSYGKEFAATKMVSPGKHRYAFVQLNWFRYHDLVDRYTPSGRDANPARPDGAYIQSHDDLKEGNVGVTFDWSREWDYRDFTGSGSPTP